VHGLRQRGVRRHARGVLVLKNQSRRAVASEQLRAVHVVLESLHVFYSATKKETILSIFFKREMKREERQRQQGEFGLRKFKVPSLSCFLFYISPLNRGERV
jgi:hypothetical protein